MSLRRFLSQIKRDIKYIFHTKTFSNIEVDYEQYWAQRQSTSAQHTLNSYQKFRAEWIVKHTPIDSEILDIAAGTGSMTKFYLDHGYKNIKALETSDFCIQQLSEMGVAVKNQSVEDLLALENIEEVDVIILSEILEHVPRPEKTLLILQEKARKHVIFSFPNTGYYAERLRLLLGKFPVQWRIYPGEHLRFWTYSDLKNWLECLGLTNQATIEVYEGLPFLNKVFPSVFGKAFIVKIDKNN